METKYIICGFKDRKTFEKICDLCKYNELKEIILTEEELFKVGIFYPKKDNKFSITTDYLLSSTKEEDRKLFDINDLNKIKFQ